MFSKIFERRCKQTKYENNFLSGKGYFTFLEYLEKSHYFYH